jgi:hypothetical protein
MVMNGGILVPLPTVTGWAGAAWLMVMMTPSGGHN